MKSTSFLLKTAAVKQVADKPTWHAASHPINCCTVHTAGCYMWSTVTVVGWLRTALSHCRQVLLTCYCTQW